MKTIPSPSIMNLNFWVATSANNTHAFDMIAYFLSKFPSLSDAGVSGYPQIFKSVYSYLSPTVPVSGLMGLVLMLDTTNSSDITSLFDPIFSYINTTWPGEFAFSATPTWYSSHYAWYEVNYDPSPAGYENVMSSRLLDREALTGNLTMAKEAYELFAAGGGSNMFMVSGKGVHDAVPRGGSNAVLPAWRSTYVHASEYQLILPSFYVKLRKKRLMMCFLNSRQPPLSVSERNSQGNSNRGLKFVICGSERAST
jgi:hypothetical protein